MIKYDIKKVILVLLLIVTILVIVIPNFSRAEYVLDPDRYKPGSVTSASGGDTYLKDMANTIVGVIRIIGSIISVIVLIVLGVKYMMGSAEERAEYKKTMTPYLIGAVLLFGITNILVYISNIVQEVIK